MTSEMSLAEYLAGGGKLTSPANVPPRYRAELMKIMAGFADVINAGPGIKERIAAARIVLEKIANADRALRIMGEFGADRARYADHHPWTARLPRDADIGASRGEHDMRLAVFNYPLQGWADAVVMNLLMGRAVVTQLEELAQLSYQPLAEAFRAILPVERSHAELALKGMRRLVGEGQDAALRASVDYWWPRVGASFGTIGSRKFESLCAMRLRHRPNEALRADWAEGAARTLTELGSRAP